MYGVFEITTLGKTPSYIGLFDLRCVHRVLNLTGLIVKGFRVFFVYGKAL